MNNSTKFMMVGIALTIVLAILSSITFVTESEAAQDSMVDLGTLGGTMSEATGINSQGQVIGWSTTPSGHHHAFLWEDGTMTDLGTLGGIFSEANNINERGQVVGWSTTPSGHHHAFLWEDGTMTDLGTLGADPCLPMEKWHYE